METNNLDSFSGYEKVKAKYPYISIDTYPEEIGLLLQDLPKGTLPVSLLVEGRHLVLPIKIDGGLKTLAHLCNIQEYKIHISKEDILSINSISDLLDVEGYNWMQ